MQRLLYHISSLSKKTMFVAQCSHDHQQYSLMSSYQIYIGNESKIYKCIYLNNFVVVKTNLFSNLFKIEDNSERQFVFLPLVSFAYAYKKPCPFNSEPSVLERAVEDHQVIY